MMHIASEPDRLSIMARIAKVRERMLIEMVTGIPASSKAIFLPLCQHYEQRGEEKSYLLSTSSLRDLLPTNPIRKSALKRNARQWQGNFSDWVEFSDWDPE